MRKGLIAIGIIVAMVGLASSLQAGGIINKQNLSADYIRTLSRNAATWFHFPRSPTLVQHRVS